MRLLLLAAFALSEFTASSQTGSGNPLAKALVGEWEARLHIQPIHTFFGKNNDEYYGKQRKKKATNL